MCVYQGAPTLAGGIGRRAPERCGVRSIRLCDIGEMEPIVRMPLSGILRVAMLAAVGLSLLAGCSADSLGTASVSVLVVAALIAVVGVMLAALASDGQGLWSQAARQRRVDIRTPSRQCDPDAAGHPRPRAPGRCAAVACC